MASICPYLGSSSILVAPVTDVEDEESANQPDTKERKDKKDKKIPLHPYFQDIFEGGQPSFRASCEALERDLPLLSELAKTPQDPEWHAEGDVAIHTEMVMDALASDLSWEKESFPPWQAVSLWSSALLHDIAKPLTTTTREFDGRERVIAPQHARRGASWLAYRLFELGLPIGPCLSLLSLVAYHHDPKKLVEREKPIGLWRKLARRVSMPDLYRLEKADMTGRICVDQAAQLETVEMFKLFCQEYGLWEAPYEEIAFLRTFQASLQGLSLPLFEKSLQEGLSAWDEGQIYSPEEAVARSFGLREKTAEVLVTFGLSGCGKSRWVQENYDAWTILSLDLFREDITGDLEDQTQNARVLGAARDALKEVLRRGGKVVWDATNLRREFRQAVLQTARDYGAHTTLAVFCTPLSLVSQRDKAREHTVGGAVLRRQIASLEWPSLDEAHRTLYIGPHGDLLADTRLRWQRLLAREPSKVF